MAIDYNDAPELVSEFLSHKLVNQGKSEKTCFQYYHDLRSFFRYLLITKYEKQYGDYDPGDLSFSEVTDDMVLSVKAKDINNFILHCKKVKENGEAAINRKISALRSLYKYLHNVKMAMDKNPTEFIETPKRPKRLPKYLNLDESLSLLESVDGKNKERDYAILTIFLNCGLRVSELCGISLKDMDSELETLRVIGKGNKERLIYLNDACRDAIRAYLEVRPKDARPEARNALFISRNRNRISDKTVQWLVYKYLKESGLDRPGMSVHKLRHTAATLMYQHGHTDVRVLKDILGHEDLSTTEIYTHVSDTQMRDAASSNPLAKLKPPKKRRVKSSSDIDTEAEQDDTDETE